MEIAGYKINRKLNESQSFSLYYGQPPATEETLLLEMVKFPDPGPGDIAHLRWEHDILRDTAASAIVKPCDIRDCRDGIVLAFSNLHAVTLKDVQNQKPLGLGTCLPIAIQTAAILEEIHRHNIVHGGLNPYNILLEGEERQVRLWNFGLSTLTADPWEEYLPYISPEQTGRMNRLVDYRTDFYSLGATLYEMLTGAPPFMGRDRMEAIFWHIAKKAIPPSHLHNDIPPVVSDLVMKLLAKNAEDRYQSAYNLKTDLQECHERLQRGSITAFPLAQHDFAERLTISQKLYGRDREIEELLTAWGRARAGGTESLLIAGVSGVGKSALIAEIEKSVLGRGYFVLGQYGETRDIPYGGLLQAFRRLIRQILTEAEGKIQGWREDIAQALGGLSPLIAGAVPEIEYLLGRQSPLPTVGPVETKNRFNLAFQKFFSVFPKKEHPLVMGLENLQWADSESLQLVKAFLDDPDNRYFLFVGTYREDEVGNDHPLATLFSTGLVRTVRLGPLSGEFVQEWVRDTLPGPRDKADHLAQAVHRKTGGQPLFVREFLKTLYRDKMFAYRPDSGWVAELEKIEGMPVSEGVVGFLVEKIAVLPADTREILELAACFDNVFTLKTLSMVAKKGEEEIFALLYPAVDAGIVIRTGSIWKFAHEKVQEAIYSLLSPEFKRSIHYHIGKILLAHAPVEKREEHILEIVPHLNLGLGPSSTEEEKYELARLNFLAGKKAKAATAYEQAQKYFEVATSLLGKTGKDDPEFAFDLCLQKAECAYVSADFAGAERFLDEACRQGQSKTDKARVYVLKMQLDTTQGFCGKAVDVGREGLRLLGISVPSRPTKIRIFWEFLKIRRCLRRRKIEDLLHLPEMVNPEIRAAMDLLMEIAIPGYFLDKDWMALAALKMVGLSLRYGNAPASSYSYVIYGQMLGLGRGDWESGNRFGEVGLQLSERFPHAGIRAMVYFMFGAFLNPWVKHLKSSIPLFQKSCEAGIPAGAINYVAYSKTNLVDYMLLQGCYLKETQRVLSDYSSFVRKIQHGACIEASLLMRQMLVGLTGEGERPLDNWDDPTYLARLQALEGKVILHFYYLARLRLFYLFEKYRDALDMARQAEPQMERVFSGQLNAVEFCFYYCLTLAALYPTAEKKERKGHLRTIHNNRDKLRNWAGHCPANFSHKYLLVDAEMARIEGRDEGAITLYERAISAAAESGYTADKAIACELAARFHQDMGRSLIAKTYFEEARYQYSKWGATAKVELMEKKYPQFFLHPMKISGEFTETRKRTPAPFKTPRECDAITLLKAGQAISEEISLDRFLRKWLQIAVENAGAQKGLLVVEKEGKLAVELQSMIQEHEMTIAPRGGEFFESLLNYVRRTLESVILEDAIAENDFAADPYVVKNRPRSVLCTPIVRGAKFLGILYLENNWLPRVFTGERLNTLKTLSAQAAISWENAGLYQKIQDINRDLRQEIAERREMAHKLEETNRRLEKTLVQLHTAQEQLIRQERLRALGEMISGIAHDFNNHLTPILGFSELIRDQPDIVKDKKRLDMYLYSIHTTATAAAEIVRRLREFYRQQPRNDLVVPISLNKLVKEAISLTEPKWREEAQARGRFVSVEIEPGNIPEISGSDTELREAVMNLIFNAVDAMPNGGTLLLKTYLSSGAGSSALPAGQILGACAVVQVQDSGTGMSEETRRHCLEPFFTTKGEHGSGLGLAMVYGCVQRHHGAIEIETEPGKGSTFILRFPVSGQAAPAKREKSSLARLEALRVLVVEDSQAISGLLTDFLKKDGHSVETAANGVEGIEKFAQRHFDLVVTDRSMPKMGGDELATHIKRLAPSTPIIMLTGFGDIMLEKGEKPADVDLILHKPITLAEFRNAFAEMRAGPAPTGP